MPRTCIILGSGGHARVLIDSMQLLPDIYIAGILTPDRDFLGLEIYTVPVLGDDSLLPGLCAKGIEFFVVGLGGVGNNLPRKKLFELASQYGLRPLTIQHPFAFVSQRAVIGEGCQLLAGCIINAGAQLGINVIVDSGALIEHDCMIGNHAHIASGAKLAGAVNVEAGAHVGAGATIRQGINIGENAVVGAGAVVVKDVVPGTTVAGVPAKILEKVSS